MTTLLADLRLALRACRRAPGFTVVVLVTLALGIGANTTIFSLVYAVLLRPFPYAEPQQLVRIRTELGRKIDNLHEASIFDARDWREQNRSFKELAVYWSFVNTLSGDGPAQSVLMTFATPELFSVLGVQPMLGRAFTDEENQIGGAVNKVILSHGLWQTRFGARGDAIGQSVRLRGDTYTVIGVMPPGFRFPERSDVWVPLMSRYASYPTPWWQDRNVRIHSVIGRLKEGLDLPRAQADLDAVAGRLARDFPTTNTDVRVRLVSLRDAEVGALRPYLVLLLASVALVLSIACVNIANLFLVRALSRDTDMAIRTALGASRVRLIRQTLTETALLSVAGGALGTALAYAGAGAISRLIPIELPFWLTIDVNGWVLVFSAAVSITTGVIVGVVPALHASRRDLAPAFRDGVKGSAGPARQRLRHAFVVAEVALAVLLFVGAVLMTRSFINLHGVETGFDSRHLLSAYVGHFLPNRSYEEMIQAHATDFRRILDRLYELPGVTAAGGATEIPFYNRPEHRPLRPVAIRGQNDIEQRANLAVAGADITPGFLHTMGIPVLEGRDFAEADDRTSPYVVLVSRRLAHALWPGRQAIGQTLRIGDDSPETPWHRVIGVVGDTRWGTPEMRSGGEAYFSYRQWPTPKLHLIVRTQGDAAALTPALRRIVQEVNPENAITYVQPMERLVADTLWQRRLWAYVLVSFAGLALLLVSVGVYGVMSHSVRQRTREIGIRMALGADRRTVLRNIVGQGLVMVAGGIGLGLVASTVLGRLMTGLLYGVNANDPLMLTAVSAALIVVASLACSLPAWRAVRIDPTTALRSD
jgi:putative ABC transport system permease protein